MATPGVAGNLSRKQRSNNPSGVCLRFLAVLRIDVSLAGSPDVINDFVIQSTFRHWVRIPVAVFIHTADKVCCTPSDGRSYMGRNEKQSQTDAGGLRVVWIRRVENIHGGRKLALFQGQVNGIPIIDAVNHLPARQQIVFGEGLFVLVGRTAMRTGNDFHTTHIRR